MGLDVCILLYMSDQGSKADGLKFTEIRELSLAALEGGSPGHKRPIRKRGFHRALKRQEFWAVTQQDLNELCNAALRQYSEQIPSQWERYTKLHGLLSTDARPRADSPGESDPR